MRQETMNREASCDAPGGRGRFCDLCDVRERSICADMNTREMLHVEKVMAHRNVAKGKAIMVEGEPNDELFIVVSGSFRLSKYLEDGRRQVTGFLFKGDFAGVRACDESAYTAEALEDSLVCRFPHKYLDEISQSSPGIKDRLIARGQTEYHKAQDHIVLLGKKNAEERVFSFLEMIGRANKSLDDKGAGAVPLSMPRQDIADYLGLRLETLSRTFAALKEQGAISEVSRKSVMLSRD
ncbi:MAG: cyclic nucleotide-binding domain-containing protein [Parvularculaceae bacterium]